MDKLKRIVENLNMESKITPDDIPDIDLYMDQVIQLFEKKYGASKRYEEDKVLTKTMINNYAKGKLFFPIKQKKYSKEHILLISLIYQLKGALSIQDIKAALEGMNSSVVEGTADLEAFYSSYNRMNTASVERFKEEAPIRANEAAVEIASLGKSDSSYLEQVLLITTLAHQSNLYRKAAEKLVDDLAASNQEQKSGE